MKIEISAQANTDLDRMVQEGLRQFGRKQTEGYLASVYAAFRTIADFPYANREYAEFKPPVRVYPHRSHLILYRVEDERLTIVRVRHGREDWNPNS
ncbi:type II toxin-antitoxin system RelE/ParE family toxin [Hyphomonas sp.]|uniref:type II toxin-antitoxin system RelE/ParE family toxin n=1 Tax=Hyphomonas sp. TaxID=87 RepID=UPI0033401492